MLKRVSVIKVSRGRPFMFSFRENTNFSDQSEEKPREIIYFDACVHVRPNFSVPRASSSRTDQRDEYNSFLSDFKSIPPKMKIELDNISDRETRGFFRFLN